MSNESSRQSAVEQLINRLGGNVATETHTTTDSARQLSQDWPRVGSKAPSFRQFLRSQGYALTIGWLILSTAMLGLVAFIAFYGAEGEIDINRLLTSKSILLLLVLESIIAVLILGHILEAYLLAQRGAILLDHTKLIERSYFGRIRVFGYEQIFEAGFRVERTGKRKYLRYYAYDEHGEIDPNCVREAHLINVQHNEEMISELRHRMAGPLPTEEALRAFRNRFMVNPFLLVFLGGPLWLLWYFFIIAPLPSGTIRSALEIIHFLVLVGSAIIVGLLRWKRRWRDE
jgi:hypothetical protein